MALDDHELDKLELELLRLADRGGIHLQHVVGLGLRVVAIARQLQKEKEIDDDTQTA